MADKKDDFDDSDFISKGNGRGDDDEDIQIELLDPDNPDTTISTHSLEMAPANPAGSAGVDRGPADVRRASRAADNHGAAILAVGAAM